MKGCEQQSITSNDKGRASAAKLRGAALARGQASVAVLAASTLCNSRRQSPSRHRMGNSLPDLRRPTLAWLELERVGTQNLESESTVRRLIASTHPVGILQTARLLDPFVVHSQPTAGRCFSTAMRCMRSGPRMRRLPIPSSVVRTRAGGRGDQSRSTGSRFPQLDSRRGPARPVESPRAE